MKGLFNSKKPTKKQPAGDDTDPPLSPQHANHHHQSRPSQSQSQPQSQSQQTQTQSHTAPSRSEPAPPAPPVKPSPGPSKKPASPASPGRAQRDQPKSRSSRSFGRHSTDARRGKPDLNTHPLNLPPDEIKRLSALSAMSDRSSFDKMDVDKENAAQPSSSSHPSSSARPPSSPPPPQPQKSFSVPINSPTNGAKSESNGEGPAPPPHRSNPSSPVPNDAEQAENYKSLGNKSFKDRQYKKAIKEYSQGTDSMAIPT